jgi:transposase
MFSTPHPHDLLIGLDRSDKKADLCLIDTQTGKQWAQTIDTAPEALEDWLTQLRQQYPQARVGLILEQPALNLIGFLESVDWITLYAINPITLQKFREAFVTSRAKDDTQDAYHLAELLFTHHTKLKAWKPEDPQTRLLQQLVRHRRAVVDERTGLTNRLQALLKQYFPQALILCGEELWRPLATDFLLKWPTLQKVRKTRPGTLKQFYHLHGSRSQPLIQERLDLVDKAVPLTDEPALIDSFALRIQLVCRELRMVVNAVKAYDHQIAQTFAAHPDHDLFDSLPGAGPVLAPRLLATLGSQRERFINHQSLQHCSGIAPVTKQSGNKRHVHRRYLCSKFERQGWHEYAKESILWCRWAAAYYWQQREKGSPHHTAVRALAFKWQRVIFRCWQDRTAYDDARYEAVLRKRNSPLVKRFDHIEVGKSPWKTAQKNLKKSLAGSPQR